MHSYGFCSKARVCELLLIQRDRAQPSVAFEFVEQLASRHQRDRLARYPQFPDTRWGDHAPLPLAIEIGDVFMGFLCRLQGFYGQFHPKVCTEHSLLFFPVVLSKWADPDQGTHMPLKEN